MKATAEYMEKNFFPLPNQIFSLGLCSEEFIMNYMMAKRNKAFRGAALLLSKTALLFCHILIAMSIAPMIQRIIGCQTKSLAAKTIEYSIVFAVR